MAAGHYCLLVTKTPEYILMHGNVRNALEKITLIQICIESLNRNKEESQKRKSCQGDCLDCHWTRWRQVSTSPLTTRAVILTTLPLLWWHLYMSWNIYRFTVNITVTFISCETLPFSGFHLCQITLTSHGYRCVSYHRQPHSCSIVCSGVHQRKFQNSASLAGGFFSLKGQLLFHYHRLLNRALNSSYWKAIASILNYWFESLESLHKLPWRSMHLLKNDTLTVIDVRRWTANDNIKKATEYGNFSVALYIYRLKNLTCLSWDISVSLPQITFLRTYFI